MDSGGPRQKIDDNRGAFHKKGVKLNEDFVGRNAFRRKGTVAVNPNKKMLVGRSARFEGRSEGGRKSNSSQVGEFEELGDIEGTSLAIDELQDLERIKIGRKYIVYRANDPIFKLTEAVNPILDEKKCIFCERDMKEIERQNCEFCGHVACLRCCHKKKTFMAKAGQRIAV